MGTYKGIEKRILKDGSENFYVRFKYLGKTYPIKNFTKLFNCTSEKETYEKLQEVKVLIRTNKDPFSILGDSLNDYFYSHIAEKVKSGDWRDTTLTNHKVYYERLIKKPIGHKKLDKITYANLKDILKTILHTKGMYQNRLKKTLNPIFKEAMKSGVIYENVVDMLETKRVDKKEKLTFRVIDDTLTIAKKIYHSIKDYKGQYKHQREQIQIFFYLFILTSHRYGELLQLTKEDIYLNRNMIVSPSNITKSKQDYHFPIPIECLEYIKSVDSGLLFPDLNHGAIYGIFQRLVKSAGVELYKNKKITAHDTRNIMLNVMIRECKIDSMLADYCLEYKQSGVIEHYLDFNYEDKRVAFYKYWELVRKYYIND